MPGLVHVSTTINGSQTDFLCEPRQSLLEVLRDVLGMTGTKEGCNDGNCGACTVILDGRTVDSCLVLAVEVQGSDSHHHRGVWPLPEGPSSDTASLLGAGRSYNVVSAPQDSSWLPKVYWTQEPDPDEERIRLWLAGNLCRCTGYDKIIRAVMQARDVMKAG